MADSRFNGPPAIYAPPRTQRRRTATNTMAGHFDPLPVLASGSGREPSSRSRELLVTVPAEEYDPQGRSGSQETLADEEYVPESGSSSPESVVAIITDKESVHEGVIVAARRRRNAPQESVGSTEGKKGVAVRRSDRHLEKESQTRRGVVEKEESFGSTKGEKGAAVRRSGRQIEKESQARRAIAEEKEEAVSDNDSSSSLSSLSSLTPSPAVSPAHKTKPSGFWRGEPRNAAESSTSANLTFSPQTASPPKKRPA